MSAAGLLADARVPCRLCGDILHREADLNRDEWVWRDENGSQGGMYSDLRQLQPDPYAHLAWLGEELGRAQAVTRKVEPTWLYWRLACSYSSLKVRLEMGGAFHQHYPAPGVQEYQGPPPPECCAWPMRLRPSGWHCRQGCGNTQEA